MILINIIILTVCKEDGEAFFSIIEMNVSKKALFMQRNMNQFCLNLFTVQNYK